MKKQLKRMLFLTTVATMTMVPMMVANAGEWKQDAGGGWKVENPDGSNLVNEWYQDADGSWYYMGADGYMMTNTTTPDGYFVGEDGVWRETENTAAESLPAQQTAVPKNEESVKAVVEAYKNKFQYYSKYSCRLVNTGNPDIPVCVITSNHKSYYAHQYRDGVIDSGCYLTGSDVYYADGGNAFCEYKRKEDSDYESRIFWGFEEDGSYKVIGMSWKENNVYSVKTKVSSKEAYDQYNNSFGPLIKLDEGNTFPDLDAAYADYMAH